MSVLLPPPQTREFADRLASLAAECREELEQSTQALQEIGMLLHQTQSEVDRLSQREHQSNARIREMESSIESYPRTEIRENYLAAHEIQLRLFMMRSQLEALQSRRESIETQQQKLRVLLNLAEISREQSNEASSGARTRALNDKTAMLGAASVMDLAPELIQARESERARISQQLTNGPAQVLANLVLRTEIVKRAAERMPERVPGELDSLRDGIAKSLLDVRRSIFEMRPLVLDELGLVPTLRRYVPEFARENGATISVSGPDRDDSVESHTRVALFRLIQQALATMITPGAGTNVQVDVRLEEAQLLVRMDATQVGPKTANSVAHWVEDSYTRETLDLIGGSMQQESLPSGVRITIIVPIHAR